MQITIEGISPYDGVYPFTIDTAPLTTTEWHWIKRHSGYMPLTMEAGIEGGDPTLICAFAVISLYRAGKVVKSDVARVYELLAARTRSSRRALPQRRRSRSTTNEATARRTNPLGRVRASLRAATRKRAPHLLAR